MPNSNFKCMIIHDGKHWRGLNTEDTYSPMNKLLGDAIRSCQDTWGVTEDEIFVHDAMYQVMKRIKK